MACESYSQVSAYHVAESTLPTVELKKLCVLCVNSLFLQLQPGAHNGIMSPYE